MFVKVMLDTNFFNHLVDGEIDHADLKQDWEFVITHIQRDELERVKTDSRREALKSKVTEVRAEKVATTSAVYDVSRWGEASYTGADSRYKDILERLNARRMKVNNIHDALIGDTCLQLGISLVTNDQDFKSVMEGLGGTVWDLRR